MFTILVAADFFLGQLNKEICTYHDARGTECQRQKQYWKELWQDVQQIFMETPKKKQAVGFKDFEVVLAARKAQREL